MISMRRWLTLGLALAMVGCAKLPDGGIGAGTTRLIFRMRLKSAVNPNFIYMVALRPSTDANPPEQGPIPVIAPPWGNGFVAGTATHFVEWANVLSPKYQIFQFRPGTDLIEYFSLGVPAAYTDVNPGVSTTIEFELNLAQIASSQAEADSFQTLQLNFLTMDRIPQGSIGSKNWDALGDGRLSTSINSPITIPLRVSGTYDNSTAQFIDLEPEGDVLQVDEPSLDIIDWSVEVRRSS